MHRSERTYYRLTAGVLSVIILVLTYVWLGNTDLVSNRPYVEVEFDADRGSMLQLLVKNGDQYLTNEIPEVRWNDSVQHFKAKLNIPECEMPGLFRLDFGSARSNWKIYSISLAGRSNSYKFEADSILEHFKPNAHFEYFRKSADGNIEASISSYDAYVESDFYLQPLMEKLEESAFPDKNLSFIAIITAVFSGLMVYYFLCRIRPAQTDFTEVLKISILLGMICTPFVTMTVAPVEDSSENRSKSDKPVFTTPTTFAYPSRLTRYIQDQFGFRKELITLNSYWKFKLFRSSAIPQRLVVGKNSWLFSTDPDIVGDYQNLKTYTEADLEKIRYNLEELHRWYNSKGIKFYVFAAPSKQFIYPEMLPDRIRIRVGRTKLDQVVAHMNTHSTVKILTAHAELLESKKNAEVFYAHDTHWNFQGGYIGYQVLMAQITKDFPGLKTLKESDFTRELRHNPNADLARMLSLEHVLLNDEWVNDFKEKQESRPGPYVHFSTVTPLHATVFSEHPDTSLPRAVIYRDSFMNLMIPYFMSHFEKAAYIWTYEHSKEATDVMKPDMVLMEIIEARLDRLLEPNPKDFRSL